MLVMYDCTIPVSYCFPRRFRINTSSRIFRSWISRCRSTEARPRFVGDAAREPGRDPARDGGLLDIGSFGVFTRLPLPGDHTAHRIF
jgi:hypothetical protein